MADEPVVVIKSEPKKRGNIVEDKTRMTLHRKETSAYQVVRTKYIQKVYLDAKG